MVTECSNPACAKPLLYLREGRVVLMEIQEPGEAGTVKHMEHFWLCGPCSKSMYVASDHNGGVKIVSRFKSRRPAPLPQDTPLAS